MSELTEMLELLPCMAFLLRGGAGNGCIPERDGRRGDFVDLELAVGSVVTERDLFLGAFPLEARGSAPRRV